MESRATKFVTSVLSGDVIACEMVRLACERHMRDLERDDIYWDFEEEEKLHHFFPAATKHLSPADIAGEPIELIPAQSFFFGSIRCWRYKADDTHRFNRALCLSGRGGFGKSASMRGLSLYYTIGCNEVDPQPEAILVSQEHRQLHPVLDDIWADVQDSEAIQSLARWHGDYNDGSVIRVRTGRRSSISPVKIHRVAVNEKAGGGKRGQKPSVLIVEEAQSITAQKYINDLRNGAKNRPHFCLFWFGNSGHDLSTPLGQLYTEAKEGLKGQRELDDGFMPLVFETDLDENLLDESDEVIMREVKKANPLFPVSPREKFVKDALAAARTNPAEKNLFLNQVAGVWTSAATAWLPAEVLTKAENTQEIPEGSEVFLGLDLSKTGDMSAVGEFYPEIRYVRGHCWLPLGGMADRSKSDQERFRKWAGEDEEDQKSLSNHLTLTKGHKIDYLSIVDYILALRERYEIIGLASDGAYIRDFKEALDTRKVAYTSEQDEISPNVLYITHHPQGISGLPKLMEFNKKSKDEQDEYAHAPLFFPNSLTALEKDLLSGEVEVEKQPLLRWTLQSVEIGQDTVGNRYVVRKPSTGGMVDLAVAAMEARGLADAWRETPEQEQSPLALFTQKMERDLAEKKSPN